MALACFMRVLFRSPALLGIHLRTTGITESAERTAWLERLLRNTDGEKNCVNYQTPVGPPPTTDESQAPPQVRGAKEACQGLRAFSCAALLAQPLPPIAEQLMICHQNSLEDVRKWQATDDAMQIDSPASSFEDASAVVQTALKVPVTLVSLKLMMLLNCYCRPPVSHFYGPKLHAMDCLRARAYLLWYKGIRTGFYLLNISRPIENESRVVFWLVHRDEK